LKKKKKKKVSKVKVIESGKIFLPHESRGRVARWQRGVPVRKKVKKEP
jgi:hypothetical protein